MKNSTKTLLFLSAFVALVSLFAVNGNVALGAPSCASGDGCLPTCPNPPGDPDCVNLGVPGLCPNLNDSAGLIPCGKNYNDPATSWDECADCTLCHLILMGQLIIEFLVKMAAIFAILAIIGGGLIYVFSIGSAGTIEKAKTMIKYALLGFLVVFIAWAVIDSILVLMGYIDPIGGDWHMMNC